MQMTNFDSAAFLRDCWQQRPVLIRNPWPHWRNPLAGDELAGLACEPGVEARLVMHTPDGWRLEHGPYAAERFGALGEGGWSLLVQAVDQHVPAVADLLDAFRFVPNWRVDDVMVSYAVHGGGVGPHFDQYDVFLVQGAGRRRWRVGGRCDAATELIEHDDLRLLKHFSATDEWVLEAGDILYIPPGFAHDGVAEGTDCMTYSIGFRAPSQGELIAHFSDHLLDGVDDDARYTDPGLPAQDNPGEITPQALERLHAMVTARLADRAAFARWFGSYTSTPKYPDIDWSREDPVDRTALARTVAAGTVVVRNPASRFAFVRTGGPMDGGADEGPGGAIVLFVDGAGFDCAGPTARLAEAICAAATVRLGPEVARAPAALGLLADLLDAGVVDLA